MKNIFLLVLLLGFISAPACAAGVNDIFKAVKNGDKSTVLAMLKKHPKLVLSRDSKGKTPLLVAVEQKNVAMADLLLRRGSRFTAKSAKGTPLHVAVLNQDEPMIQLILTSAAKVGTELPARLCNTPRDLYDEMSFSSEDGSTPLHLAAKQCNTKIYNYLVAHGGNPNLQNNSEKTPAQLLNNCLKSKRQMEEAQRAREARKRAAERAPKDDGI